MSDNNETTTEQTSVTMLKIPRTPAEFAPPRPSSVTAEMGALLRNKDHYADILPLIDALAGATESVNGSARYDEAYLIIEIKEMCQQNGYDLLADLNAAEVSRVFKSAYKVVAKHSFGSLLKQGNRLRLEHKKAKHDQAPQA